MEQCTQPTAQIGTGVVTEKMLGRRALIGNEALGVDHCHDIRRVLHQGAEARLVSGGHLETSLSYVGDAELRSNRRQKLGVLSGVELAVQNGDTAVDLTTLRGRDPDCC